MDSRLLTKRISTLVFEAKGVELSIRILILQSGPWSPVAVAFDRVRSVLVARSRLRFG